jgi:hypothetical protein
MAASWMRERMQERRREAERKLGFFYGLIHALYLALYLLALILLADYFNVLVPEDFFLLIPALADILL